MRYLLALVFALIIALAQSAYPQDNLYRVEIDLDGMPGDGPDLVDVDVSDVIIADMWVDGPLPLVLVGATFCNLDGSLDYLEITPLFPEGWWIDENLPPPGGCIQFSGADTTGHTPLSLPWRIGTFTIHAAVDESIDDLQHIGSGWMNTQGVSDYFDEEIGATVRIGATATEKTGWGRIKSLFR